jgi:hypothetical protein
MLPCSVVTGAKSISNQCRGIDEPHGTIRFEKWRSPDGHGIRQCSGTGSLRPQHRDMLFAELQAPGFLFGVSGLFK